MDSMWAKMAFRFEQEQIFIGLLLAHPTRRFQLSDCLIF
jgi:hypothetical protein